MKYLMECLPWGRFLKMGEVNLLFSKTSGSDGDDMGQADEKGTDILSPCF